MISVKNYKTNSRKTKFLLFFMVIIGILYLAYYKGLPPGGTPKRSKIYYKYLPLKSKKIEYDTTGYKIKCQSSRCPQSYKEAKERIISICKYYALILLFFYKEIRNFFLYKIYYPDKGIKPKNKKISGKIDTKNFKN